MALHGFLQLGAALMAAVAIVAPAAFHGLCQVVFNQVVRVPSACAQVDQHRLGELFTACRLAVFVQARDAQHRDLLTCSVREFPEARSRRIHRAPLSVRHGGSPCVSH